MWWFFKKGRVDVKSLVGVPVYVDSNRVKVFDDYSLLKRISPYQEEVEVLYPEKFFDGHKLGVFRAKVALAKGIRLKDTLTEAERVGFFDVEYYDGYKVHLVEVSPTTLFAVGCYHKTEKVKPDERYIFETEFGEVYGDVAGASDRSRNARLSESFVALRDAELKRRQYPVLLLNSRFIESRRPLK